jgi:hypothetical protein
VQSLLPPQANQPTASLRSPSPVSDLSSGIRNEEEGEWEVKNAYAARNSSRSRLNVTRIASAGRDRIGR